MKEIFNFQTSRTKIKNNTINELFINNEGDINTPNMFIAIHGTLPNVYIEKNLNIEKALKFVVKKYGIHINDVIYNKKNDTTENVSKYDDIIFSLFDDTLLHFDHNQEVVKILTRKTQASVIEGLSSELKLFKELENESKLFILIQSSSGIYIEGIKVRKFDFDVHLNYNEDFIPVHKLIQRRLSTENDKGIVLLHGEPGTGKTSYIRYLISNSKKKVIFVPHDMAKALASPDLISVLLDNKNSILVIEDAENIILDRNSSGNSPVSTILNLSDGLLSDCLNIQIICTFNSDYTKIDQALTRKGRLIAQYDFKKLTVEKANSLAKSLGLDIEINQPMSLTDIYNMKEKEFQKDNERQIIGFSPSRNVG